LTNPSAAQLNAAEIRFSISVFRVFEGVSNSSVLKSIMQSRGSWSATSLHVHRIVSDKASSAHIFMLIARAIFVWSMHCDVKSAG